MTASIDIAPPAQMLPSPIVEKRKLGWPTYFFHLHHTIDDNESVHSYAGDYIWLQSEKEDPNVVDYFAHNVTKYPLIEQQPDTLEWTVE